MQAQNETTNGRNPKLKNRKCFYLCLAACLLSAFALWTAAVCTFDVQPIGPLESVVGFASINRFFHNFTGIHMTLYVITDWLGLVPLSLALGFALLGALQWLRRKSLQKVDRSILALGAFYLLVVAAYLLFEKFAVNHRPVLIDGRLEPSYPSSTTLLSLCVMPTAAMQLRRRIRGKAFRRIVIISIAAFTAFMVAGRLISGVHWLSDILGSVLLSMGLVALYATLCSRE